MASARHCYVVGCANREYQLTRWPQLLCKKHKVLNGNIPCDCTPGFSLITFPTERKDLVARSRWLEAIQREDPKHPLQWLQPSRCHRVCSTHFVDGKPTVAHPDPELHLGHQKLEISLKNTEQNDERHKQLKSRENLSPFSSKSSLYLGSPCSSCSDRPSQRICKPLQLGFVDDELESKTDDLCEKSKVPTGLKVFKCMECGKELASQFSLNEHKHIHTDSKPFSCAICGFKSRQMSVHLRHLTTHDTKTAQHSCGLCSKSFRQLEYLRKHLRKHYGEMRYSCPTCSKSFTAKSELNRHSLRHTAARPHECPVCHMKFKMSHNLRHHTKSHEGGTRWKCTVCHAVFYEKMALESHCRLHTESGQLFRVMQTKDDPSSLSVLVDNIDRRKLPSFHSLQMPQDLPIGSSSSEQHFLQINNSTIPLGSVQRSVSAHGSIHIRVADTGCQMLDGRRNERLVIGVVTKPKELHSPTFLAGEETVEGNNPVQSLEFLCRSPYYLNPDPHCVKYHNWLTNFVTLCQQLELPLHPEVASHLCHIVSSLLDILTKKLVNSEQKDVQMEGSYQGSDLMKFINEVQTVVYQKLQGHINSILC